MSSHGSMNNVPGSLKFGLNISAKKAASLNGQPISTLSRPSPTTTKPPSKQPLFAEEDDDDNDNPTTESAARAKVNASIKKAQSHMDKVAAKEYEKVLQEDPNAFDYDGVYDDMKKTEERRKKGAQEAEGDAKKPRYIGNLLQSAQDRKAELLRIQERKIQREREEEKEKYGEIDSEKFVTSGYKKQMEEQRAIEEAEKRKEQLEDVTKKRDLTDFYRNVLNTTTRTVPIPDDLVFFAKRATTDPSEPQPQPQPSSLSKPKQPAGVRTNDADEIVDKRDLLSAGLNVLRKPQPIARDNDTGYRPAVKHEGKKKGTREEETRRVVEMVERQRIEREMEDKKREREEQEALAAKMARHNDQGSVSDAKRRYLERKRQKEEEEARVAAEGGGV